MATATKQFDTFLKKGAAAQRAVNRAVEDQAGSPASPKGEVGELMSQFFGERKPGTFMQLPVDSLHPSKTNPRKAFSKEELEELARSIQSEGILQPLVVRPAGPGMAEIVTGERRWRAAQLARLDAVPCIVREMTDSEALDAQIAENLQRQDITPLEEAAAYRARLKAAGDAGQKMSVDQLAERIGKSRRYVYDKLQLLDLGAAATKALAAGKISSAYASELVRQKEDLQNKALEAIASEEVGTVKQLREWISGQRGEREQPEPETVEKCIVPVRHATREQLEAWAKICCADSVSKGLMKGLLYEYESGKFKLAESEQMNFGRGSFYAVTGSVSSGREGVIELHLAQVVRRSHWKGRTWTYRTKPREEYGRLSYYVGIRAKCSGREWVFAVNELRMTRTAAAATHSVRREIGRAEWSATAIKREMRDAIEERFGADFRVARIAAARKRGEWLAVIVQTPAQRAKARKR